MRLRNVRSASVKNKRVLVRVDINAERDRRGRIRDTSRMEALVPTISWLRRHGARVVLLAHQGRPTGRTRSLSLRPYARPLARILHTPVTFLATPPSAATTRAAITKLRPGQVALLENLRFYPGEEKNQATFVRQLAAFGDLYVNEAFSVSHRAAASVVGLAKRLPAYAGLRLLKEIAILEQLRRHPRSPYVAVIGGAKISTKLLLIQQLAKRADAVVLGGALANTALQASGQPIGRSLAEPKLRASIRRMLQRASNIRLPVDVVVQRGRTSKTVQVAAVRPADRILDIGPGSLRVYAAILRSARTIVWNGPLGVYEQPPFDRGTAAMARAIARSRARAVAGGGETLDAIRRQRLQKKFYWLSTGGGAMLEFLEGRTLPGLQALTR